VNKLTSVHTQLPYKYYDKLPFCAPTTIEDKAENLGEILMGDRIENSNYEVRLCLLSRKFVVTVSCVT
jgi:transmembrane 9 superfamily protein 2/4